MAAVRTPSGLARRGPHSFSFPFAFALVRCVPAIFKCKLATLSRALRPATVKQLDGLMSLASLAPRQGVRMAAWAMPAGGGRHC